jgi:copper chaperone
MASGAAMHAEPGQIDAPAGQTVRPVYTFDQSERWSTAATARATTPPACAAPSPFLRRSTAMSKVTLNVPDISCEHCELTITNTLQLIDGVRSVSVDIPAKQVRVHYDEAHVNVDQMKALLQEEDYPVESVA